MKELYLLRHAKSDWDADFDRDRDRPVGKRGRTAARKIARYLDTRSIRPDLVLCSDALRTRQTIGILLDTLDWPADLVRYEDRLYLASVDSLYEVIAELKHERSVLIVGHQPTLARAVCRITGRSDIDFPTATFVRIDLAVDGWTDIGDGTGKMVMHVMPRSIDQMNS